MSPGANKSTRKQYYVQRFHTWKSQNTVYWFNKILYGWSQGTESIHWCHCLLLETTTSRIAFSNFQIKGFSTKNEIVWSLFDLAVIVVASMTLTQEERDVLVAINNQQLSRQPFAHVLESDLNSRMPWKRTFERLHPKISVRFLQLNGLLDEFFPL